jgi:hypothetical protein
VEARSGLMRRMRASSGETSGSTAGIMGLGFRGSLRNVRVEVGSWREFGRGGKLAGFALLANRRQTPLVYAPFFSRNLLGVKPRLF